MAKSENPLLKYFPAELVSTNNYGYIALNTGHFYSRRISNNFIFGKVVEHRWRKKRGPQYVLVGEYAPEYIMQWILENKTFLNVQRNLFGKWEDFGVRFSRTIYYYQGHKWRAGDVRVESSKGFSIWIIAGMCDDKPFWKIRIQKTTGECEFIDMDHQPTEKEIEYYKIREEVCD